jgi:outer membrane protein OmpA-like peptidoglycan-associated protein
LQPPELISLTMLHRIFLSFLSIVIFSTALSAQSVATMRKLGDDYFRAEKYTEAVEQYSQYQMAKPGDLEVLTRLGIAYFHLRNLPKAVEYFEFVLSSGARNANPEAFYYLGKSYHLLEKWPEAIKYYKLYLGVAPQKHPMRQVCIDDIRRCAEGRELLPSEAITIVQNLGPEVNTVQDEFGPVPSLTTQNRLFFTGAREESVGGLRRSDGIQDEVAGKFTSDIYYTEKAVNGTYSMHQLSDLINTARHERLLDFGKGGKVMYYFRGFELYAGDVFVDTAGVQDEHKLEPTPFDGPFFAHNGDSDLFIVHDSMCIFASRREGGQGGLDLYYALRNADGWQTPVNFGPNINSAYDDCSPFLTPDGNVLYFSSNRPESIGGLDVFFSNYDPLKKSWEPVVNMSTPLNSAADDFGFRVAANGKTGWFASDRSGGIGGLDLYQAFFRKTDDRLTERVHPPFLGMPTNGKKVSGLASTRMLKPLMYSSENDILSPTNLATLKDIVSIAKANTTALVIITCHVEEVNTPALDAFVGIKRAQIVADHLIKEGLSDVRLTVRSGGAQYPAALNVLGEEHNELAKKYNNRITVELVDLAARAFVVSNEQIQVPEVMRATGQSDYAVMSEGLSYRVYFLNTQQMFTEDILGMFTDISIERFLVNGNNQYNYFAGLSKEAAPMIQLRDDLRAQGFQNVRIVPFMFGREITREEAAHLRRLYPDLTRYLSVK